MTDTKAPSTRKRRGRGEGGLRLRTDGSWEARLTINGRPKSFYGKTKTEARQKLDDARRAYESGLPVPNRQVTVERMIRDWLDSRTDHLRPSTLATYRSYAEHHILPSLGRLKLHQLGPEDVERMLRERRKAANLSPRTVAHLRAILRAALSRSEKLGQVARNVARLADPPPIPATEAAALTPEQAGRLIAAVREERNGAVYIVAATLGLRLGECLGLRWQDVDFEARQLRVAQQYQRVGGEGIFGPPKSAKSRRTLPLPNVTADALREQRDRQQFERKAAKKWADGLDLVFAGNGGQPLNPSSTTRRLHGILAANELPDVPFHGLRHSCASALAAAGTPVKLVAEILGHTSEALTQRTYQHVFEAQLRTVADTIDATWATPSRATGGA